MENARSINPLVWLRASLRRKLTVGFLAVALVPVTVVGIIAYEQSRTELIRGLGESLTAQAVETIDKIDRNLFERYGDVQAFAYPRFIRGGSDEMAEAADFYIRNYGIYDLAIVTDAEGRVVGVNRVDHEGKPIASEKLLGRSVRGQKWFEAIKSGQIGAGQTYYEDLAEDPWVAEVYGGRGLTLNFSAPIFDEQGALIGAWSNRASFERVASPIMAAARQGLAEQGFKSVETQVLRKDGVVLDDADPEAVLRLNLAERGLEAAIAITQGRKGYVEETHRRRFVDQVNAFAPSKGALGFDGYGWGVLLRVDRDEAMGPAIALRNSILLVVAIAIVAIVVVGIAFSRALMKPIDATAAVLDKVAEGSLVDEVEVRSEDEIGRMGEALNRAVRAMRETVRGISASSLALAGSSEEMSRVSEEMTGHATETSQQASVASAAAEQVSRSIQTVATGAEEMSASIREIAGNAAEAARVAGEAVKAAENTGTIMTKLDTSSAEIGEVVKVITSIAEQTNLLALNATIEAARAGEAGKGFAVVANEVKELAKGTAQATDDIGRKVELIQTDTRGAVEAIQSIRSVINRVSDIASMIASAVEEQSATTSEMSRNVAEAAQGGAQIAQSINSVAEAAEHTTQGAGDVHTAAAELARMATELRDLVSRFRFEDDEARCDGSRSFSAVREVSGFAMPLPANSVA